MGLQSAGKTTLIKHIFEGKDWPELKNIEMTEFVDTFNYKYRGYLDITIFDAGGQKQFLESYFNEIWGSKIFSSVNDSSTPENFNKAKSKLKDCLEYLNKNSNNVLKYLILSKYDIHKMHSDEIVKNFEDFEFDAVFSVSIPMQTARKSKFGNQLNKLNKLINNIQKSEKFSLIMLINNLDGLKINFKSKNGEIIDDSIYKSYKSLLSSFDAAEKILDIPILNNYDFSITHFDNQFLFLYKINKNLVLISLIQDKNIKLAQILNKFENLQKEVLKCLKK